MFKLDPWQKKFLETKGDKILCTGRQVGKSVICGMDAGMYALSHQKEVILMIAPTERQAYALFEKTLDFIFRTKPTAIKKGKDKPTKHKITLVNGTQVYCLPTGVAGAGIRFLTVNRLYADEASRIPEDVWTAVTPMLMTTGGDLILLSTPFGTQGYYYDILANKDDAFKSFTRFYAESEKVIKEREICDTWTELQRTKALEYIDRERKRMGQLEFAQEYLGKPLDDLRQFFPTELIKSCMVLERGISSSGNTFLGVDVARLGGDETVLLALDRKNEELYQIEMELSTESLLTDTIRRIKHLDNIYHFKKIYIDDGGMGVGVFDPLLEDSQTKRKVVAINNARRSIDAGEFKLSTKTLKPERKKLMKEDLYNNLLHLMEMGKVKLFKDPEIFQSLKSVQVEIDNGKLKIFGKYTHIAEALIRAAWCMKDKTLNIWIDYR